MTINVAVGGVATIEATFYDQPGGSATDPTSVSLSVLDPDGNTDFGPYTYAGGTITRVTTGFYRKQLTIPTDTTPGAYTAAWTVVIDGDTRVGYETVNITAATLTPAGATGPTAPVYCTREDVARALDVAETARANDRIDRAIETARDEVDGLCRRRFVPWVGTRYFDWPDARYGTPGRLWLDGDELVSATSVVSGGTTISASDYFLEPANSGPPYRRVDIDRASSASYSAGTTPQRSIAITGTYGYTATTQAVGTLSAILTDDAEATASAAWSAPIGVGTLLRIGSEYLLVTERSMVDTGQNIQDALTASTSNVAVTVTDGTVFNVGDTLAVDTERMLVVAVTDNTLTVKRAWDGTVLAAHTDDTSVYNLTGVSLLRAQCGTTAAEHASDTTIYRHVVPGLVRDLAVGYALNQLLQEGSGYARVVGAGDATIEVSGKGLKALEDRCLRRHGRQLLMRTA